MKRRGSAELTKCTPVIRSAVNDASQLFQCDVAIAADELAKDGARASKVLSADRRR